VSGAVRPGGARILPVTDGAGQLAGLRIAGAGAGSIAAAIGLRNGDVLAEINGKHIESANTLIDVYGRLDELNTVELDGTRGKQPLALTLRLR
jgi:S1-C subfamily serine protease